MEFQEYIVQQKEFLDSIFVEPKQIQTLNSGGMLEFINSLSILELEYALGEFGERLHLFTKIIDLKHPDLNNIYKGELIGLISNSLGKEIFDLVKLSFYIKQNNLSLNFLHALRRSIEVHNSYRMIERSIDSPLENQLHVRFVASKNTREHIRSSKKVTTILVMNGSPEQVPLWESIPDTLSNYCRGKNVYEAEIEAAKIRERSFLQHGLSFMAKEIAKNISDIQQEMLHQTYFGFNKIKLQFAAMALAKMSGYERVLIDNQNVICLDIANCRFDFLVKDRGIGQIAGFNPKAYTHQELYKFLPDSIKKLIDHLENFPEIGNRPLFDHYRIVVPSPDNTFFPRDSSFLFKDQNGNFLNFQNYNEAQMALDIMLIEQKVLLSALVGERDGEYYFISYCI